MGSPCPAAGDRFVRHAVSADARSVAHIREVFARWLRRGSGSNETTLCDVVLAVNEALANAAEFAYCDGGEGTLDIAAVRDPVRRTLTVTVSDRGRWREINPLSRERTRGRGIPLMRTLADSVIIDTSGSGTSVRMRFDGVSAAVPSEVAAG